MWKYASVLVLAAAAGIGYAVRPVPVVAQGEFQPFTVGATVRLEVEGFPGGPTIDCKVAAVSNDFIQCGAEGQRRPRAVNLRYVKEIAPGPER